MITSTMSSAPRVIVLGAGWSGLAAASTYLKINPEISLTILDASNSPGGVWSKSRLYPGLLANSPSALYEFSDLSMKGEDHKSYVLISGEDVQEYLERYAKFRGLYGKIRFGVYVVKVRRRGGLRVPNSGWLIETSTGETMECDKLIVATGLHSKPKMPSISQESYTGVASIHSRDLGKRHESISSDANVQSVVVVGGCKSAIEACSLFLTAGKRVHWIVRPSEQGVPIVVLGEKAPFNLIAVNNTRLFSVWGPSIFDTSSWWYRFLHQTASGVGVWLRNKFWERMTSVVKESAMYGLSENGRLIEPKGDDMFYDAAYIGVLHERHPFLRWMHDRSKIEVHRARPIRLVGRKMEVEFNSLLEDGKTVKQIESVPADVVVWCTGWQPSIDFFDPDEARFLCLPTPLFTGVVTEDEERWKELMATADLEVEKTFPQLSSSSPRPPSEKARYTPFRMHRQMISPDVIAQEDRSISFCGLVSSSQTAICSELMALWGVAWMEGLLPEAALPRYDPGSKVSVSSSSSAQPTTDVTTSDKDDSLKEVNTDALNHDIARVNSWMAHRYGYRSTREPAIIREIQTFLDTLIRDLGLPVYRKWSRVSRNQSRSWFWRCCPTSLREWIEPYAASDYSGVVEDFLGQSKRRKTVRKV